MWEIKCGLARHLKHTHTAPAAFTRMEFPTYSFLLASLLEQTFKNCMGNTQHTDVNVNAECNSK